MSTDGSDDQRHASRPHGAGVWALALVAPVLVVALVFGLVIGIAGGDADETDETDATNAGVGLAAVPLDLASASPDIAAHFTYAKDHQDAYSQIPCYCGCEKFLGHRNLYDCFVRSDGEGWDAHASGCGVCIGESATARLLLDEGQDPTAVRDAVVAQFGSTPGTAPPRA